MLPKTVFALVIWLTKKTSVTSCCRKAQTQTDSDVQFYFSTWKINGILYVELGGK